MPDKAGHRFQRYGQQPKDFHGRALPLAPDLSSAHREVQPLPASPWEVISISIKPSDLDVAEVDGLFLLSVCSSFVEKC